ncbi:MAG: AraC family transcriptional regulator [Gammaproteobacteria bacterium]|nr:AraC family transcriptional regulator [Gammaproteobacteria bacterium]
MPKPKQSLTEPTTVAAYVEAITRALQARGADPDEVLREIDVSRIHGNDPLVRITDSTVNAIYARAVALTGDEYFGLRVAEHIVPGTLHALGYALLASETLEDFCHRFVRYYGLVSQSADLRILVEGDTFRLEADPRSPDICVETQDVWAALVLRLMRMAYRADFCPRALDLRRPVPAGGEGPFRAFFGCPVRFGQPHLGFHFDLAAMREPLLGANRELAQHNDQIAMTYLEKLDREGGEGGGGREGGIAEGDIGRAYLRAGRAGRRTTAAVDARHPHRCRDRDGDRAPLFAVRRSGSREPGGVPGRIRRRFGA